VRWGKMREIEILVSVSKFINELQLLIYLYVEAPVKFKLRFELQELVPKLRYYNWLLDSRLHIQELLFRHPHIQ
jgi:hypothetical protein